MENNLTKYTDSEHIKNLIYIIRNKQVMLDSDLAVLYRVETRTLNQAVRRNIKRFPEKFMFQLTDDEFSSLISQFVISNNGNGRGGRRKLPYVFTEQGISMLSAVLRSDLAIEISIKIMDTFVEMRKFLTNNQELFSRISKIELKQLEADQKFEQVFNYIASKQEVTQKVFFDGQIYDAFSLFVELIEKADKNITLIDNYVNIATLNILSKRKNGVKIDIFSSPHNNQLSSRDIRRFKLQYQHLNVRTTDKFHDRFLIFDHKTCYHIGASLKDAGKKSFAISKMKDHKIIKDILERLN